MASPTIQFYGFDEARRRFGDLVASRALTSSINKISAQTKTQISKEVRKEYNVKAAPVRQAVTIHRARIGNAEAFVIGTGARIPLKNFGARGTRRGVTVRVKKASGRKLMPHAFFVGSIGGNVFIRTGEPKRIPRRGRYAGRGIKREPIKKLFSLAIPQMIGNDEVVHRILAHADSIAPRIFQHELGFYSGRLL